MNFVQIILTAAKSIKVSGVILVAVCSHESGLNNVVAPNDGGTPSIGICQIKYDTATMLGYNGDAKGLTDPATNAKFAALYLKYQYDRYQNWCMAIAAYNAGKYNESQVNPGYPKNLKYVIGVKEKLSKSFQNEIACGILSAGVIDVAANNGTRRRIQSAQP